MNLVRLRERKPLIRDLSEEGRRRVHKHSSPEKGLWSIRCLDFFLALLLSILTFPLMILVAVLIRVTDKSPILFWQCRVGQGMESIKVVKFRTMVHEAENLEQTILDSYGEPNVQVANDKRVTRLGRVLRSLSLDELPQLLLVLSGGLSLVGPRPLIKAEVEMLPRRYLNRFRVPPGITGLAQVFGRGKLSVWEILEYDLQWVEDYSFALYIKVLLKTLTAVFRREEAV